MKKVIFKIKVALGFCECKKCWRRAYSTMTIKQINKSINLCEEHMEQSINGARLIGFTFEG